MPTIPTPPPFPSFAKCSDMNNQLKLLSSRTKSLEQLKGMADNLNMIQTIKNIVAMFAIVPNGSLGALVLLADPNLIMQIAQNVQGLLDALPGQVYQQFQANLALNINLTVPSMAEFSGAPIAVSEDNLASCGSASVRFGS